MVNNYQTEKVEKDPLAIGLTRPVMFMGLPIRLFFGNAMLGSLICIDAHTFLGIPLMVLLHLIMAKLALSEPLFFKLYFYSFIKTPPVMNYSFWGKTNTYLPW